MIIFGTIIAGYIIGLACVEAGAVLPAVITLGCAAVGTLAFARAMRK